MNKLTFLFITIFCAASLFSQAPTISDINFEGLKRTKEKILFRVVEVEKDEELNLSKLEKDIIQLKRLPAISHAYYKIKNVNDTKCIVTFFIEENFTVIPEVNLWTTTNKRLAYKLGVYDYNFLGRNIGIGGFYQQNGFDSYGFNFRAPMLFSRTMGIAFNHQNWSSEEPLYFGDNSANYKYQNISYELLLLCRINFKHTIDFGVNLFNEKYTYLSGHTMDDVPQQLDLNKKLLKFVYTYDDLNYFYHYVEGFKSQLYGQYVTTINEYQNDFFIAWNDAFYFKRIGEKGNWANRLRIGLSTNEESPFAPFALDNNVNLRGVGILVDRGTGSIVWNTEYRHTLYEKNWFVLQGNVFTDFGTWRTPGGSLKDFVKSENVRVYSGVGLRFISKKIFNAVFRIDYGYGVTPNSSSSGLVFGIGQYF
ncbi:Surface antigen variable number repeat-containing protein [Tenacibaculum sp. MAR_2009_124]|uniref:POTRA domain-containing protein n=1 Tax=Tenacibaculum sp. MAR_2009_124 TaxID=1250059 RepID=UPI00089BE5C9|nr:POTRA domain-containing protein [Tenacibaculum sp. MAR_2009_124]SEC55172.1 Surface antigen variable number repeat-containing protein [Tenacibaculum sp. MAR_2009_124]